MSLSLCPSYWLIKGPSNSCNLRIQGLCAPKLFIDWSMFQRENRITTQVLLGIVPISIRQRLNIQCIIAQPFSANVLIVHHNMYEVLGSDTSVYTIEKRNAQVNLY